MNKNLTLFIIFTFLPLMIWTSAIEEELVFAFRKYKGTEAQRMVVVGEVVSIEKAELLESNPTSVLGLDTRPDNVVVKLLNPDGVRVGQTLYLIEKHPDHRQYRNGNIVGEINVKSIFDTTFFGKQLRGVGYTRLIENRPMTVVRPLISEKTNDALDLKRKGDSYAYRGEDASAMKFYRQAISLDHKLPDSHFALGLMFKKEGNKWSISSLNEFSLAWKYRESFSDSRDRFTFYQTYLNTIKDSIEDGNVNPQSKKDLLNRGLEIILNSELVYGKRFESSVFKAWFNYKTYLNLPSNDKSRNSIWEKTILALVESEKFLKESLFFHQVVILVHSEYLNGWNPGKPKTSEIGYAMEKIRTHGRMYLTINPPGAEVPESILNILELIE